MAGKIENHTDLQVYQKAFEAAMKIFVLSKSFPPRGDILAHRSGSSLVTVSVLEFSGRMAQAAV